MGFIRRSYLGVSLPRSIIVILLAGVLAAACGKQRSSITPPVQSPTVQEQLAELEQLVPPPGVDAAVFQGLKDALAAELRGRDGGKMTSKPPGDAPTLSVAPATGTNFTLSWGYRSSGDYNQDGVVNIADITPLAIHFNETAGTGNHWIDGNGDTAINISDITPLAVNFGVDCAGYDVYGATSPTSEFSLLGTVSFGDALDDGDGLYFDYVVDAATLHAFKVVSFDGEGNEGAESNIVPASAVAPDITAVSPLSGNSGEEVGFSATVSGSTPMTFHWEFGDGADPNTVDGPNPDAVVTLGAAGDYSGSVTATNAIGEDTFNFDYTVNAVIPPPTINSVTPTSGMPGTEVTFTADVVGDGPITYDWDFGGGAIPDTLQTVDDPQATVTLAEVERDYSASLTATNAGGSDSYPFTLSISSVNRPPTVVVTVDPLQKNRIIAEADDPDGDPLEFHFGLMLVDPFAELVPTDVPPTTEYTQVALLFNWHLVDFVIGGEASCTVDDGVNDPVTGFDTGASARGQIGPDNSINMTTVGNSVKVGEELRVIVYFFNSAQDVREFPAVRIEFDDKLDVDLASSYNVGYWGYWGWGQPGDPDQKDGAFWMAFDTANDKILPPPSEYASFGPYDANYWVDGVQVPPGRKYFEARALPDGGSYKQLAGGAGYVFNFTFIGVTPGTANVRFISQYSETEGGALIDATYYTSETDGAHHLFDDLDERIIEVIN